MIFFTYPKYIQNNYAIINCNEYLDFKNCLVKYDVINMYSDNYKIVFLEPEVMVLKKQNYYRFESWLNISKFLNNLPKNCYFSLDYPNDMNIKYSELFIQKSFENVLKYGSYNQYINTIQFRFMDIDHFKQVFNAINFKVFGLKSGILAIGNLCRLYLNSNKEKEFMKQLFQYIRDYYNYNRFNWIHIYGLGLRYLRMYQDYLFNCFDILSFDSTKWTKAVNKQLKLKYGLNCNRYNRQEFYDEYVNTIINRGIDLLN